MALLQIETDGKRETVIIDEVEYKLTPLDGFSIVDQQRFQRIGKEFQEFGNLNDFTAEQAAAMESAVNEVFEAIAGTIPQSVKDKLFFMPRMRLIQAYFLAIEPGLEKLKEDLSQDGQAPGSQPSDDSTGEV